MDDIYSKYGVSCVVWEWAARTRIKPYSALDKEAKHGFNETKYI